MVKFSKEERKIWARKHWDMRSDLMIALLSGLSPGESIEGAEVGVWKGDLICQLLDKEPRIRKIYGIDPYRLYMSFGILAKFKYQHKWDMVWPRVQERLSRYGDRVELWRMDSDKGLSQLPTVDFIELDGDHSYKQVMLDIENSERRLRPGGLLCGHDYVGGAHLGSRYVEGVADAVNEYAEKYGRDLRTDSETWMWWWFVP